MGQVSTIILSGLTALFGSLLIVPLADLIDESAALRAMSVALLVVVFYGHQRASTRPTGGAEPDTRSSAAAVDRAT